MPRIEGVVAPPRVVTLALDLLRRAHAGQKAVTGHGVVGGGAFVRFCLAGAARAGE